MPGLVSAKWVHVMRKQTLIVFSNSNMRSIALMAAMRVALIIICSRAGVGWGTCMSSFIC